MQTIYSKHRRSWLLGLFVECPYGEEIATCPAREIRKLSVDDRIEIAERVGHDVVNRFLEHHRICMSQRERLPEA